MKKVLLIIVALFGIASANAQFKDSGFKMIGEVGTGISTFTGGGVSLFGAITPGTEFSFGANLSPQIFLGVGLGYDALIGISDVEGATDHEGKVFAHGRFYLSSEGNGAIIDLKAGYKRNFTSEMGAADIYVGPGFMFGGKFTLSAGYAGSFYDGISTHGGAIKFGVEF